MQTLRQEAEGLQQQSASVLWAHAHMLDLCPKPTHTEPFLFTLLVLKNVMKSPGKKLVDC